MSNDLDLDIEHEPSSSDQTDTFTKKTYDGSTTESGRTNVRFSLEARSILEAKRDAQDRSFASLATEAVERYYSDQNFFLDDSELAERFHQYLDAEGRREDWALRRCFEEFLDRKGY